MMTFKAIVKDKQTKKVSFITITQTNKAKAIYDIRGNGYSVDANKVKSPEVFDFILDNTNASPEEWKYINRLPEAGEYTSDWITEGLRKEREKQCKAFDILHAQSMERHKQFLNDIGMSEEEFQADILRRKGESA